MANSTYNVAKIELARRLAPKNDSKHWQYGKAKRTKIAGKSIFQHTTSELTKLVLTNA